MPNSAARQGRAIGLSTIVAMLVAALVGTAPTALAAPAPSVALDPTSGPPGTQVHVTGKNWPPGHSIAIAFPDRGFWGPGSTTVGPDGSFTYSFAWPSPAEPGDHQVAVIDNTGPVDAPPYPDFTVTPGGSPAPTQPGSAPAVSVGKTYVANANWAEATRFGLNDLVRYQIVVSASGDAVINARMRVAAPDGRAIFDGGGDTKVSPKAGSVFFQSTIPADASPGTYTEEATVTYDGVTTTRTSTFSVAVQGGAEASRVRNAIDWANAQVGRGRWNGLCEVFVENAYGTQYRYATAQAAFLAVHTSTDRSPNVGSLVFFKPNDGNQNAGHVGIYLGDDQFISATEVGVKVFSISNWDAKYATYEGWGDPPTNWTGR